MALKRSELQRSSKPMKRTSIARHAALRSVTTLTSRPRRRTAAERAASEVWGERGPCEISFPHLCEGRVENHHVVDQQKLREIGREDLLWDPRNRLRVDYRTHRRHTAAVERIPLAALTKAHLEFAAEIGLTWWIERFYAPAPVAEEEAA